MLSGIIKDFAEKGLTTGSLTKSFLGFSLATMTLSSMGVLGLGLSILPTIFCWGDVRPPLIGVPEAPGLLRGLMRIADLGVMSLGLSMVCALLVAEAIPPALFLGASPVAWGCGVVVVFGAGS